MTISVHLSPSNPSEHEPGHMAAAWHDGTNSSFRGYVFKVADLPQEYRNADRWREYLFKNTVPGHVTEDIGMRDMVERGDNHLLTQSWPADAAQLLTVMRHGAEGQHGEYSFNPDDHPGAHNCVTWATSLVNAALGEVLPKVRQGRIKLMAEALSHRPNQPPAS